jgi:nucleolar protein 14
VERERGENMRHELDEEFDSLRSLLYAATGSNTVPLGDRESESNSPPPPVPSIPVMETVDAYDQRVRELASDRRAKAKDRTKTEEELALEAKEALEEAERRRQRRMLGEDDDSGSDDGRHRPRGKRHRERGGDDLEDNFQDDFAEWNGIGPGLGMESGTEQPEASEASGSASEGETDSEESESEGSEAEDGDEGEEEEEADSSPGSEEDDAVDDDEAMTAPTQELPFIFPCPTSHEEFLDILEDVSDADVPTVIHRIRALYHPSLGVDNKAKLQVRRF